MILARLSHLEKKFKFLDFQEDCAFRPKSILELEKNFDFSVIKKVNRLFLQFSDNELEHNFSGDDYDHPLVDKKALESISKIFPNLKHLGLLMGYNCGIWQDHLDVLSIMPISSLYTSKFNSTSLILRNNFLKKLEFCNGSNVELILKCANLLELDFIGNYFPKEYGEMEHGELSCNFLDKLIENSSFVPKLSHFRIGHNALYIGNNIYGRIRWQRDYEKPRNVVISPQHFPALQFARLTSINPLFSLSFEHNSIRELHIDCNNFLTKLDIKSDSLVYLSIHGNPNLKILKVNAPNLTYFVAHYQTNFDKISIKSSVLSIFKATFLCKYSQLLKCLEDCPSVQQLTLGAHYTGVSAHKPTDKLMEKIPEKCPNLKLIDISKCVKITERAIKRLLFAYKSRGIYLDIVSSFQDIGSSQKKERNTIQANADIIQSCLKKWKKRNLFKIFNTFRVFRDASALKALITQTDFIGDRLEWEDLKFVKYGNIKKNKSQSEEKPEGIKSKLKEVKKKPKENKSRQKEGKTKPKKNCKPKEVKEKSKEMKQEDEPKEEKERPKRRNNNIFSLLREN